MQCKVRGGTPTRCTVTPPPTCCNVACSNALYSALSWTISCCPCLEELASFPSIRVLCCAVLNHTELCTPWTTNRSFSKQACTLLCCPGLYHAVHALSLLQLTLRKRVFPVQHPCGLSGANDTHDHDTWRCPGQRGNDSPAAAGVLLVSCCS